MITIEIADKSQNIIFSNISSKDKEVFKNDKSSKKDGTRSIFKKDKNGIGFWMITNNKDIYKSVKVANKNFDFLEELFNVIHKHYEIITLSNTHTIATIQAKMSQQIETLVGTSKEQRGNYQTVINNVKNTIEKDTHEASKIICGLNKRIEEIDTHLKSLQILENKTAVDLKMHPLRNMLLSIYSPFQNDFKHKQIKVNFERINDSLSIKTDYKIFSLIMHHFFDNAVKYSKDDDEISFVYASNNNLVITMHSITIKKEDNIFEVGVSGKNTDTLAGDGIGMHVIKKGLNVMDMDIDIEIGDSVVLNNHPKFSKNCFIIKCII